MGLYIICQDKLNPYCTQQVQTILQQIAQHNSGGANQGQPEQYLNPLPQLLPSQTPSPVYQPTSRSTGSQVRIQFQVKLKKVTKTDYSRALAATAPDRNPGVKKQQAYDLLDALLAAQAKESQFSNPESLNSIGEYSLLSLGTMVRAV